MVWLSFLSDASFLLKRCTSSTPRFKQRNHCDPFVHLKPYQYSYAVKHRHARMQKTMPSDLEIQIITEPDTHLLRRISSFHMQEANWPSTVFELKVTLAVFAVATTPDGLLVGVASIHSLIPSNYWIGNVVVAVHARKQGIASRMVSRLMRYAEQRAGSAYAVLVASRLGENLYRRLGFESQNTVAISVYERSEQPPPLPVSPTSRFPDQTLHKAAVKLDEECIGINRGSLLNSIYKRDKLCAVLTVKDQVVAAAWGRLSNPVNNGIEELHIGPVVAKCPQYATSVVAELLRMELWKGHCPTKENENCRFSTVLVVEKGNTKRGKEVFEALGYVKGADLPYMAKRITSYPRTSLPSLDVAGASSQYYAMAGWDIC